MGVNRGIRSVLVIGLPAAVACSGGADPGFGTTTFGTASADAGASDGPGSGGSADGGTDSATGGSGTDGGSTTASDGGGECGNGVAETGEDCDAGDLGGGTCESAGFAGGALACNADCTFDTSACTRCGNDAVEMGEECDGADLGAATSCEDLGLGQADESLSCTATCAYDLSMCSGCPDGTLMSPEECEPPIMLMPPNLGGETCESLGFDGGVLSCDDSCRFDTASCHECGDNVRGGPEACDGADFGTSACTNFASPAGPNFTGGTLACNADCTISTANCMYCGDGVITGSEVCDGSDLAGETCSSQGFTAGVLTCNASCTGSVTAQCTLCGDGTAEGNEQCDGTDYGGEDCISLGFNAGQVGCTAACVLDASSCVGFQCGDGSVNLTDECDCGMQGQTCTAAELDNNTCADLLDPNGANFTGGALACNSPTICTFDTSGCWWCGNDVREGSESCDGQDLNMQTCATIGQGFTGGTLACKNDCSWDIATCTTCGNDLIEGGEICDGTDLGAENCITVNMGYVGGTLQCNGSCSHDTSMCSDGNLNNVPPGNACNDYLWCSAGNVGQGPHAFVECFPNPPISGQFDITQLIYEVVLVEAPTVASLEIYDWTGSAPGTLADSRALNAGVDLTAGQHTIAINPPAQHTGGFCIGVRANDAFTLLRSPTSSAGLESFIEAPACGLSTFATMATTGFPGNWCMTATIE